MLEASRDNAINKTNKNVPNFSFWLKGDRKEKVWLAFESKKSLTIENQITVYFGLHFEDKFEQQLGKIFFSVNVIISSNLPMPKSMCITHRK